MAVQQIVQNTPEAEKAEKAEKAEGTHSLLCAVGVWSTDGNARSDNAAESSFHCQAAFAIKLKHLQTNSIINAAG